MEPKRILFLDFDGVLTSQEQESRYTRTLLVADPGSLDPNCVKILQNLLNEVKDLNIVISSTWKNAYSLNSLKKILKVKGLVTTNRIIDVTPYLPNSPRSEEINAWLNANPGETQFAIVDDEPGSLVTLITKTVITNPAVGLKQQDAKEIILKLFS
jgi:hypothetical protein